MELQSQKSKRRMRFFSRRTSSTNSNVSFKSVGSTFSFSSANSGSKDENFFESNLNLESDVDEDFHSVHGGDSTSSETATPNNTRTTSSKFSKSASVGPTVSNDEKEKVPSNDLKPKLVDLLKEEQNSSIQELGQESANNLKIEKLSSIASRGSSVDEMPSQSKIMRNRSFRAMPCCFPCLPSNSKDRRKMKTEVGS